MILIAGNFYYFIDIFVELVIYIEFYLLLLSPCLPSGHDKTIINGLLLPVSTSEILRFINFVSCLLTSTFCSLSISLFLEFLISSYLLLSCLAMSIARFLDTFIFSNFSLFFSIILDNSWASKSVLSNFRNFIVF